MKKTLKITSIILLAIVVLLIAIPILCKGKIESLLKETINKNVNAEVQWQSLDLSLLSDFPNASVELNNLKRFHLELGITQLLNNTDEDPIKIDGIHLDEAFVNVIVNKDGIANYDIAIEEHQNHL